MTTRWNDNLGSPPPAPTGRHRTGLLRRLALRPTVQGLTDHWRRAHGDITSSPAPYRHLDRAGTTERDATRATASTHLDTVEMPLASAFVSVAGVR